MNKYLEQHKNSEKQVPFVWKAWRAMVLVAVEAEAAEATHYRSHQQY